MTTYVLAGGCFWCLDAVFRRLSGVTQVISGYTGGDTLRPTYEQVSLGNTGHAEAVQVTFDEAAIPKEAILDLFFLIHDPTTLNRQGNDIGTQYRSAMFYTNATERQSFVDACERAKKHWGNEIVTKITQLQTFYPAEDYHQDYFNKNPTAGYCSVIIAPKISKARKEFTKWFKD